MVTEEVKHCIKKSILCWLATTDSRNEPNVSPKEMFTLYGESTLLVANIASPQTVRNIVANPKVCVSFVDIFIQKGFKVKGTAKVIDNTDKDYDHKLKMLIDLFTDKFPIKSIIEIDLIKAERILAPSYYLYPETTEKNQAENAMKSYGVKPINPLVNG
jgi:uncharacterized protein